MSTTTLQRLMLILMSLLVLQDSFVVLGLRQRLKLELHGYEEFCFFQELRKGMNVYTDFYVIRGQEREILFELKSADDKILYSQIVTDGRFQFPIEADGPYRFCFDNTKHADSSAHEKLVNFYISTNDNFQDPQFEETRRTEHEKSDELESSLEESMRVAFDQLDNYIGDIYHLQDSFANHAMYDMYVIELILERVNFWSTLNMLIILMSCAFQVAFIRNLFENTNKFRFHFVTRPSANVAKPYLFEEKPQPQSDASSFCFNSQDLN